MDAGNPTENSPDQRARVFISYKRNAQPDAQVAELVFNALREKHDVFIDRVLPVGTRWAQSIEDELRRADFFIVLLSSESVHSEMVVAEIETAYLLAKQGGARPIILPVRLAYRDPFTYPLSAYLNPINWALWREQEDTPSLVAELLNAISGGRLTLDENSKPEIIEVEQNRLPPPLLSAQPVSLETPDGTMDPQSAFYVARPADTVALEAIRRQGVTITIKAPRQMGKSSLLTRIMEAAAERGKKVAFLDFQLMDRSVFDEPETFFRQFCAWLTDKLGLDDRVDEFWRTPLGNGQRCTRYVERYLLKELNAPLVLAMDEVESVFDAAFRSDFFGMLRSWHNTRWAGPVWKNLDLALITSTEPYQFIDDLNQSPFNVGEVIELTDFTEEQVSDLNHRHGSPLSAGEQQDLMSLLGGHPYLIRRALYMVASEHIAAGDLLAQASDDYGPFGDHLRRHLFRMRVDSQLVGGMSQVIQQGRCQNEEIFFRLHGAGLVSKQGGRVTPRYRLYTDFFLKHLDG